MCYDKHGLKERVGLSFSFVIWNKVFLNSTRARLAEGLAEELDELKDAIAAKDLVEIADALCDLQYVLSGAVLEFGMGEKFVELFNEVQRSNMSKACASLEEAENTVKFYQDKDGTEAEIKEENGVWKVYRKADNKVLKSINYSPADLLSILK